MPQKTDCTSTTGSSQLFSADILGRSIARTSAKRSERTNKAARIIREVVPCVVDSKNMERKLQMITSQFKDYSELPLFLNAAMVAKVLGVSSSSGYELMHEPGFPILKIGNRMVVPKEKFIEWVEKNTVGGGYS